MVGTPGFVAPEVLSADKQSYGEEVDIFSVGVIVYQVAFLSWRLCVFSSALPANRNVQITRSK